MRTLLALTIIFLSFPLSAFANEETDSLLLRIDHLITQRHVLDAERQQRIDLLNRQLETNTNLSERFILLRELFGEYRMYRMDSALWVAKKRLAVARELNNPRNINSVVLNIADVLAGGGMYKESLDMLKEVNYALLDEIRLPYYYHIYHFNYTFMVNYAFATEEKEIYKNRMYQYKDSLLGIFEENSPNYNMLMSGKLVNEGHYEQALPLLVKCYDDFKEHDWNVAIPAYEMAVVYNHLGDKKAAKKYMALASSIDLETGVKEYMALWKLAMLLYEEGDIDRAHAYMKCSMEDAIFCKAHYRVLEISEMLPIINSAYEKKLKEEKNRIFLSFILICILTLFLIITIIFIRRQLTKLSLARKSMKKLNDELRLMNESLNNLNKELQESNQVKEEYIGYVFNMCSNYIEKLEDFRKTLHRKIKVGQIEELYKLTSSTSLVADELKDFFRSFDSVFLQLYPDFIEEFNALLQESEQIIPRDGELMTPELRIFALVRLGINDSTKIARFLHYSTQTVYNYRLKIRNKSVVSKEEFLEAVQKIG